MDVKPGTDEMRYRAQDAMHTIARAEQHKRDPELMKHVRALAADVHHAVGSEGPMKGTDKRRGEAPKDPASAARGKSATRGLKEAQRPQGKRPSRLSSMKAAKKKER